MIRERIHVNETIATVITAEEFLPSVSSLVVDAREEILGFIDEDPEFETSFAPVDVPWDSPEIVRRMAEAAKVADVGPMAAVAGAIAQYVVEGVVALGADHIVFDNGGDIAMFLAHPIVAGIYAGPKAISGLGLRIISLRKVIGLCTSSGTVGHSFSFGLADAAIVYSSNVALADAVATRLGNLIAIRDPDSLIAPMRASMLNGIDGVMTIVDDAIGTCGQIPEVVNALVDCDLISKARRCDH